MEIDDLNTSDKVRCGRCPGSAACARVSCGGGPQSFNKVLAPALESELATWWCSQQKQVVLFGEVRLESGAGVREAVKLRLSGQVSSARGGGTAEGDSGSTVRSPPRRSTYDLFIRQTAAYASMCVRRGQGASGSPVVPTESCSPVRRGPLGS